MSATSAQPPAAPLPAPLQPSSRPRASVGTIVAGIIALLLMFGVRPVLAFLVNTDEPPPADVARTQLVLMWGAKIVAGLIALGLVFKSRSIFARLCAWIVLIAWVVSLGLALLSL